MNRPWFYCAAAVSTMAVAQGAAMAQQTDAIKAETEQLNAQAARDNAAAAAINAQTAKVEAQTKALGIPTIEGKTDLGTNAAVLETWMLSAYAVDSAGREIARQVWKALSDTPDAQAGTGTNQARAAKAQPQGQRTENAKHRILLLAGDETLSLDTAAGVRGQIALVQGKLDRAQSLCVQDQTTYAAGVGAILPVIGAVANLFKTDTHISGLEAEVPDRMLAAATGKHLRTDTVTVVLPASAVATAEGSATADEWKDLLETRDIIRACRSRFPAENVPDALKPKVKVLDEAITAANELEASLLKADDKGNTPLGLAIRVDAVLKDSHPYVLRVNVEKGGGSLLKRSNVWTTLGAPAVAITGGLVSSYTLTDPYDGTLIASGNIVCSTAMTSLRAVQNKTVRPPAPKSLCVAPF